MESIINIDLLGGLCDKERLEARGELLALHFMTYINHKMDQKGITKKQLAELVGTSPSYITQLFRGDKTPNWKMIAKMEKALELSFKIECEGLGSGAESEVMDSVTKGPEIIDSGSENFIFHEETSNLGSKQRHPSSIKKSRKTKQKAGQSLRESKP